MAKGFDHSAPIGEIVPVGNFGRFESGHILLNVNGAERQEGDLLDMIWSVPEVIAALSRLVELQPGDLIFTGTPEGVAEVKRGDELEAMISGLPPLRVRVV
jgi:fumarylpyruvate hydrolase